MIARLLGAVQFLTVLPVGGRTASPAGSAVFFPLIGAWLGWFGASILVFLSPVFPGQITALLVVVFWAAATGALHEDGLADIADAFRAGRPPERILAILKDSRIGTYGAVAIVVSMLVRWQAVAQITTGVTLRLAAALALSRAAMVGMAWISRPAGAGLGAAFLKELSTPVVIAAIAQGVGAALLCGFRLGIVLVGVNALLVLVARRYFHARIGGVTGDCLGGVCQLSEISSLLLMTCQICSW